MQVEIPDQLTWIWDRQIHSLFSETEDPEIEAQKQFIECREALKGTAWGQYAQKGLHRAVEPFLTRSMEPRRRFLGKLMLITRTLHPTSRTRFLHPRCDQRSGIECDPVVDQIRSDRDP